MNMIHPAIPVLLRAQRQGARRRMLRGFSTPRRFVLSSLGVVLAMVWLSNVAFSVLFREPMPADRFRALTMGGLLVYTLWHAIKSAFVRPDQGIEWTPAEIETLCTAPLRRHDLLGYRFAGIFNAGILKAACFTLVMSPDISVYWAAFFGFFMALVFVDLARMLVEISCWGATRANYLRYRAATVILLARTRCEYLDYLVLPSVSVEHDQITRCNRTVADVSVGIAGDCWNVDRTNLPSAIRPVCQPRFGARNDLAAGLFLRRWNRDARGDGLLGVLP